MFLNNIILHDIIMLFNIINWYWYYSTNIQKIILVTPYDFIQSTYFSGHQD